MPEIVYEIPHFGPVWASAWHEAVARRRAYTLLAVAMREDCARPRQRIKIRRLHLLHQISVVKLRTQIVDDELSCRIRNRSGQSECAGSSLTIKTLRWTLATAGMRTVAAVARDTQHSQQQNRAACLIAQIADFVGAAERRAPRLIGA